MPSKTSKSKLCNFMALPEQIERWTEAAHEARMSRSRWIAEVLDAAVGAVELPQPTRKATVIKAQKIADQLKERAVKTASAPPAGSKCDNRVPKGMFCKRCGRTH